MKEYHYHPEYKYFTYETDAFPCPRVPGEYLISANATTIEPPQTSSGFISVFDGNSWNVIKDNRGSHYCKDSLHCHYIEDPSCCVDNFTTIPPPIQEKSPDQVIKWSSDKNDWILENLQTPDPIEEFISYQKLSAEERWNADVERWRSLGMPEEWITENIPQPHNHDAENISQPHDHSHENVNPLENMSVEEKLAMIGLTVDDLKSLLS